MATEDYYLPSHEELSVPELHITTPELKAVALYMGKYCDKLCKEFMLCRSELDARKCLSEGKEVTKCGFEFLGKVKTHCLPEFNAYFKCLDHADSSMEFSLCRKKQAAFDACASEKIGVERPYVGYFSRVRIHDTNRPRPEKELAPLLELERVPTPEDLKGKTPTIFPEGK